MVSVRADHSPFTIRNFSKPHPTPAKRTQGEVELGALWVRCPRRLWASTWQTPRCSNQPFSHLRRILMKRVTNWKSIAIAALFTLLVALQPAITYACGGGHTGC